MGFLDNILGFLGGIGSAIEQAIVYLFKLIIQIAVFIWNVLVLVANYILVVFKAIAGFFTHLWQMFFKGIFTNVFHAIQAASRWLESHLRPLINFLKAAQKYIDRIYNHYIRPFIVMIQHIRQFLLILRLLHIKFAQQLDNILSTIQRDVQGVFLQIRGTLNLVIDLLNIIADPTMLLRRPTALLSVRRIIYALIRQVTNLPPGFFVPSRKHGVARGLGFLPADFNPSNPHHNPPASYYLGIDSGVPSLGFLQAGDIPDDSIVDDVSALDFFDNDLIDDLTCTSAEDCLIQAARLAARGK